MAYTLLRAVALLCLLGGAASAQTYHDSGGSPVPGMVPVAPGVGPWFTSSNPGLVGSVLGAFQAGSLVDVGNIGSMTPYQGSGTPNVINLLGGIEADARGVTTQYSNIAVASITRGVAGVTYTAKTGWNNSGAATFFTFTGVCRAAGGLVSIPEIDIWSSANPGTSLQGVLYLFDAAIGTVIADNATFSIHAADFANVTGNMAGFAFTLSNNQASGAANSSASITTGNYHASCVSGLTSIYGMVEVVNTYTAAGTEVLTVQLHSIGLN